MLRRIGKYVGYALLWFLVVVIWIWADRGSESHSQHSLVDDFQVNVSGESEHQLVDEHLIGEWIAEHRISPVGMTINSVQLGELERVALQHSAVAEANAYVTHDGCVVLDVVQHQPVARLRVDGYDMYVTSDGYLFPASDGYAVHIPVITGGYKPVFKPSETGYVPELVRDSITTVDGAIAQLEAEKIPHLKERKRALDTMRLVTRKHIRKTPWMSQYEFDKRKEDLKVAQAEARRVNLETNRRIDGNINSLALRQEALMRKKQMVSTQGEEFMTLIRFVESITRSDFWRSEVVQIVVNGGGSSPMQIAIVPRSGRFMVDMGYAAGLDSKLTTLRRFYDKALVHIGWDRYKSISLRYEGQVVCR